MALMSPSCERSPLLLTAATHVTGCFGTSLVFANKLIASQLADGSVAILCPELDGCPLGKQDSWGLLKLDSGQAL